MANQEHLDILGQGVEAWNQWRKEHPEIQPDLSGASLPLEYLNSINLCQSYLRNAYLSEVQLEKASLADAIFTKANLMLANLYKADLTGANLVEADLTGANLTEANLSDANLFKTNLTETKLAHANLEGADLSEATLFRTNLTNANLSNANLLMASLVETNLSGANLTGSSVYGISAWKVQLGNTIQQNLVITPPNEQAITVDNLEVAQFVYLLLNNEKIRDVINTIGQKGVLILGRFSKERKQVLDALRERLRILNFLPIVFDFERPTERDFTETIMTLAGLSCFIIADITNPKSSPLELQATVPNYMIPFVPIIQKGEQPFSMFQDLVGKYDWVLDILVYDTPSKLIRGLERAVVKPALEKRDELLSRKFEQLRTRHIEDYL